MVVVKYRLPDYNKNNKSNIKKKLVMRQKQTKDVFINTLKTEIKHRESLADFYNTKFWVLVEKFNGKVYNKRFDTALNDALKAFNPLMWAKCELKSRFSYSNYPENNLVEIYLYCRIDESNWNNRVNILLNLVLDTDDNYNLRINYEKSKNEKYTNTWFEGFINDTKEHKTILKCYDKYLKVAQKIQDEISKYKDLPFRFRQNIEFNELFYLK